VNHCFLLVNLVFVSIGATSFSSDDENVQPAQIGIYANQQHFQHEMIQFVRLISQPISMLRCHRKSAELADLYQCQRQHYFEMKRD